MQDRTYAVYIMTNARHAVLYTGMTSDLRRRVEEHRSGLIPGFTQKYRAKKLVYFETGGDVSGVIAREKEIKGWSRVRLEIPRHTPRDD